ncbi:MAG: hypothetical protein GC160_08650 [Acidobacteria bacterium]|nr:hypothetical protein [Acidobacteriota bacterium]
MAASATIELPDDVYREVELSAASAGVSISELVVAYIESARERGSVKAWDEARAAFTTELRAIRQQEKDQPLSAKSLVRKALALIMADDSDADVEMDVIEDTLKSAIALDDTYVEAYVELGWFYHALLDDAERGREVLLHAAHLLRGLNKDALEGLVDTECELNPERSATEVEDSFRRLLIPE